MKNFRFMLLAAVAAIGFSNAALASSGPEISAQNAGTTKGLVLVPIGAGGVFETVAQNDGGAGLVYVQASVTGIDGAAIAICPSGSAAGCLPALGSPAQTSATFVSGQTDIFVVAISAAKVKSLSSGTAYVTFFDSHWCVIGATSVPVVVN